MIPAHHLLDLLVAEELAIRQCPEHIIIDELENFLLLGILLE